MMQAQMAESLPTRIDEPKTNKHKLWNDCLSFLKDRNCLFRGTEVSGVGCSLLQALINTFWALDGHHDVLRQQGFAIPSVFGGFAGYNCPELSKHRKRAIGNLSISVMESLCSHLFDCIQSSYWDRQNWKDLKPDEEKVAVSISGYVSYLRKSNK